MSGIAVISYRFASTEIVFSNKISPQDTDYVKVGKYIRFENDDIDMELDLYVTKSIIHERYMPKYYIKAKNIVICNYSRSIYFDSSTLDEAFLEASETDSTVFICKRRSYSIAFSDAFIYDTAYYTGVRDKCTTANGAKSILKRFSKDNFIDSYLGKCDKIYIESTDYDMMLEFWRMCLNMHRTYI